MNTYTLITVVVIVVIVFFGFSFLKNETPVQNTPTAEEVKVDESVEDKIETTKIFMTTTVDLSNKGLTSVPKDIFSKTKTEVLNLSGNALSGSLPAEIRFLQNLRTLDLSDNNFTGVPAEIGQLSNLEVLNLSGNPITGLPYELANLKNLKELNLQNTSYSTQDLDIIKKGLSSDVIIRL